MIRKFILLVLLFSLPLLAMNPFSLESGQKYLKISPDGQWLSYDQAEQPGLYLLNLKTGRSLKIAKGFGIAQFVQWSPNSDYFGFKLFKRNGQTIWQIPCLFEISTSRIIPLHDAAQQAGVPSISADGTVAFTIANKLFLTDINGQVKKTFTLPDYANLTPISPDGRWIIFNDANDQLHLLNIRTGQQEKLTEQNLGYFNPQWNPVKPIVAVQSFNGQIHLINIANDRQIFSAKGSQPSWSADGTKLLFVKKKVIETQSVQSSDLFSYDVNDATLLRLTDTPDVFEDFPALSAGGTLYFEAHQEKTYGLYKMKMFNGLHQTPDFSALPGQLTIASTSSLPQPNFETTPNSILKSSAYSFEIPYVHQCFDSPDWFNGCTACGGTAATMCIAYYNILPKRPRKVYDPFYHITNYGDYIAEIYTYNGFTFDIWAYDRNGVKGYGAFGFIVRHGSEAWSDTKGFMAEFARKHGLYSYVDWSPTRQKLMTEANAKRPFVLLNSITSSGHYISVIGYDHDATTVIVNDPAGDKSLGHYGANYEGKGAQYDWPGYSNGHPNLNTVWCYIYFRDKCADLASKLQTAPDTTTLGASFPVSGFVTNSGNNPSDSTQLYVFVSMNQSFESTLDWVIDTLQVPVLAPKDTFNFNLQCAINDSLLSLNYYLGVYAKTANRANEAYLSNNTSTAKISVKGYPIIYRVLPRGEIEDVQPSVKAYFTDRFSPVDLQSVKMYLDSADVSDRLTVTSTSAVFTPDSALSPGLHQAEVQVTNSLGFKSVDRWEFTVLNETGIDGNEAKLPKHLQVRANYPNPFNNQTRVEFYVPKSGMVKAELFNIQGQRVKILLNSNVPAGRHYLLIDGHDLASGIYLLRLQSGRESKVRRMLLVK